MVDFNKNIWAPWRMEYIEEMCEPKGACFICRARDNPDDDEKNLRFNSRAAMYGDLKSLSVYQWSHSNLSL